MEFIKKNFSVILLVLILIGGLRECNNAKEIREINKQMEKTDSLIVELSDSIYTKNDFNILLKIYELNLQIEGLKAEDRMITASDRNMLDMNRQAEINKEIIKLNDKLEYYEKLVK